MRLILISATVLLILSSAACYKEPKAIASSCVNIQSNVKSVSSFNKEWLRRKTTIENMKKEIHLYYPYISLAPATISAFEMTVANGGEVWFYAIWPSENNKKSTGTEAGYVAITGCTVQEILVAGHWQNSGGINNLEAP
jgi:hypothetical protein